MARGLAVFALALALAPSGLGDPKTVKPDRPAINRLLDQFKEMKDKVDRIHFKSLAGVLVLQQKIGDECARRWTNLPAVKPVSAG